MFQNLIIDMNNVNLADIWILKILWEKVSKFLTVHYTQHYEMFLLSYKDVIYGGGGGWASWRQVLPAIRVQTVVLCSL